MTAGIDGRAQGDALHMSPSPRRLTEAERRRRRDVLDTLREAAELRARLRPRAQQLERARALLHARTTRG